MTTPLPPTATVAVLGAGTMGRGIARVAAGAGHAVVIFDSSEEALESAESDLKRLLERDVERGRLDAGEAGELAGRFSYTTSLAAAGGADLVIEAIVEDLDAKLQLLRQVESLVGDDAVIATNTSSLSVTAIGGGLERPGRLAGMHFFNPAQVMPLVEIVAGAESTPDVVATLAATASSWGKTPVQASSTPGFIVNRVARPFYGEALRIAEERVATFREVDEIVTGAGGFRMGPFALMDLVGLDVNLAVSKSVYAQTFHDPRFAPNQIQQQLVDSGRLGRKTGRGFYDYERDDVNGSTGAPRVVEGNDEIAMVIVHGSGGELEGLVERLTASGVAVTRGLGRAPGVAVGSTLLWPSDGRPVSVIDALVPDLSVVAVDEVIDWPSASAVAVAGRDGDALRTAASVLAAAGIETRLVDDGPGLVLLRIMAQLASVAADAALRGVATAEDIDTAMQLGTNYPIGPLEWADGFGVGRVVAALDNMADHYGEPRYRPSSLLRRVAATDSKLREVS